MKIAISQGNTLASTVLNRKWPRMETTLDGACVVLVLIPSVWSWSGPRFLFQVDNRSVLFTLVNSCIDLDMPHLCFDDVKDLHGQGMIPEEAYGWACAMVMEDRL